MAGDTATWEQLLGSENWDGILDPMFLSLRKLILRCGDLAEATYDAFDNDPNSDNRGNSLYPKETLFESVKVKNRADYEIVSFLYATSGIQTVDSVVLSHPSERSLNPWDSVSNWMGYVAITTDTASKSLGRREIYVVWRGTTTATEWGSNINLEPVPITPLLSARTDRSLWDWFQSGEPKVHKGWLDIYTSKNSSSNYVKKSARDQLWDVIDDLKGRYNQENLSIVVTGHSLGGSLATLSGFDLAVNGFLDIGRVAVFAFSCPKVGNEEFKKKVESYPNFKVLHAHIRADLVPNLPGPRYVPIRTAELEVQAVKSPNLELIPRPIYVHNLEVVLHMVAGWNGANKDFQLKVDRELVLVNKWTGFLIDSLNVPDSWWPNRDKPGSKLKYDDKKQQWVLV